MPIFSPYFKARFHTLLMLTMSTAHTPPCTRGCVSDNKNGGVQFRLAFVLRGANTPFLQTSVHFASMIDNIVLKIEYFGTLPKNKKKIMKQ